MIILFFNISTLPPITSIQVSFFVSSVILIVPLFNIEQQLRIRTKIHTRKNKKGFCNLSVTIACKPKDITNLIPSKYTLDDVNYLPTSLIYKS